MQSLSALCGPELQDVHVIAVMTACDQCLKSCFTCLVCPSCAGSEPAYQDNSHQDVLVVMLNVLFGSMFATTSILLVPIMTSDVVCLG